MYVVITDLFEKIQRPKALAINGLVWLLGTSLGPIMGGGFSGNVWWRWIFWIALPINACFCGVLTLGIRDVGLGQTQVDVEKRTPSSSSLPIFCRGELRASWCEGWAKNIALRLMIQS
ncbi:hypothetical protein DOTSEDRAFT_27671 [Dothistroma septosporum NZE10]|uniref:Major facilitator superfamily (MFS) profile domain-containing protein n=1 Tax=Dothistroma septosporum (strain NZE10 / CBS 128990) TaxID=675120 RepID=N1PEN7_DOTSN|nr:hypothetical protein DOTSEDRAFT_27671 [Dothistroma septosporum NZE10]